MTTWRYIGCDINSIPKEMITNKKLSVQEIKSLLDDIPLVEGQLEAVTVDAVTALLLQDGIFPIKIHPLDKSESNIDKLKKFRDLVKNNSPTRSNFKRR